MFHMPMDWSYYLQIYAFGYTDFLLGLENLSELSCSMFLCHLFLFYSLIGISSKQFQAGRRRAEKRHKFMQDFVAEFYEEWSGRAWTVVPLEVFVVWSTQYYVFRNVFHHAILLYICAVHNVERVELCVQPRQRGYQVSWQY